MIKNIINEIFFSTAMKTYLCEHISELTKHDIIYIIKEASSISLQRKLELFEMMAESENPEADIADNPQDIDFITEYSYKSYADRIRNALKELKSVSSDVFLLNTYIRDENGFKHSETVPFKSYEKAAHYIDEMYYDINNTYYILEKWQTDSDGNMNETYWYVIANGHLIYFCNKGTKLNVYPDCQLNLPVPFKSGDIITVQDMPFSKKRCGIIIDIGDNIDCCCVQVLYVSDEGFIEINALKHGRILETDLSISTSPLYSAEIFNGDLTGNDEVLLIIQKFMAEKQYALHEYYYIFNMLRDKKITCHDITTKFLYEFECNGS